VGPCYQGMASLIIRSSPDLLTGVVNIGRLHLDTASLSSALVHFLKWNV